MMYACCSGCNLHLLTLTALICFQTNGRLREIDNEYQMRNNQATEVSLIVSSCSVSIRAVLLTASGV